MEIYNNPRAINLYNYACLESKTIEDACYFADGPA